jgi:hypothetical protein
MMSETEDKSNKKYQHGKVFKKRFNFKDHYKYKNNSSSNLSVRPSNSQIIFYGNSAMEFRQSLERLESAFIQESCFELVSNGNLVPDANGLYPENTFNEAEPIEPDYDTEIFEQSNTIRYIKGDKVPTYYKALGKLYQHENTAIPEKPNVNERDKYHANKS